MSNGKSSARFLIENGRISRINRREKVAFVTVYASTGGSFAQYFDVTDFARAEGVGEGESVTVQGDVSMEKPRDGEKRWSIKLIARKWQAGKEELTPTLPASKSAGEPASTPASDDEIPF